MLEWFGADFDPDEFSVVEADASVAARCRAVPAKR
jgi:hypothetical protein